MEENLQRMVNQNLQQFRGAERDRTVDLLNAIHDMSTGILPVSTWRRLRSAILLVLFGITIPLVDGGCSHDYTPMPDQDRAAAIVWYQTYGMNIPPPPVEWIGPDRGRDCGDGAGYLVGASGPDDLVKDCVFGGRYYQYEGMAQVLWADWDRDRFALTSYAHELYHAVLWERHRCADESHDDAGWKAGGVVEQAVAALRAEGL